jgi:hypothetical protein
VTPRPPLGGLRVGVYGSGGAPWHHLALAAAHGADVRPVRAEDIEAGRLAEIDALIVPGGGAVAMAGLLSPLGPEGAEAVRRWVEAGGTYVASCAGSVLPLALDGAADAALPLARGLRMVDVPLANRGDATLGGLASPGVGRIRVRLDAAHPFAGGLPAEFDVVHYNGPFFDVSKAPAGVRPFAWPVRAGAAFTPAERFLPGGAIGGANAGAIAGANAGAVATTFDRCVTAGTATGLEAAVGRGRLLLFGSHPEFGLGPLLLGWGDAARLLVAALASVPRRASAGDGGPGWAVRPRRPDGAVAELAATAVAGLERAAARFADLALLPPAGWLDADHAAAFGGRAAADAWTPDARAAAATARAAARDLGGLALDDADLAWLDDAPRPDQDFGAMGLTQLLERIGSMLDGAERLALEPPRRPAHAYDLFDAHPFHLAVGSYLSAAGLVSAAALIVVTLAARHAAPTPALAPVVWASAPPEEPACACP